MPDRKHDPNPTSHRIWRGPESKQGDTMDAGAAARRWRMELQLSREESETQQLHVHNRAIVGLLGNPTGKMDPKNETIPRGWRRILAYSPCLQVGPSSLEAQPALRNYTPLPDVLLLRRASRAEGSNETRLWG